MRNMIRKWPAIDILKLYSGKLSGLEDEIVYSPQTFDDAIINAHDSFKKLKSHVKWNTWLRRCLKNNDLAELVKVRYGLQVGMDDVYKAGLSTPAIAEMFVRWQKSIEKTARQIIQNKHKISRSIATDYFKALEEKRRIDVEFECFLRESSF